MESIGDYLYIAEHGRARVILVNPHTGEQVTGAGFTAPEDIEGLTDCELLPAATPTPTATTSPTATTPSTPTATPSPTASFTATLTATPSPTPSTTPSPTQTSTPTPTVWPPEIVTVTSTSVATDLEPGEEPTVPTALFLPLVAN